MFNNKFKIQNHKKALVVDILELFALGLLIYIIITPIYPSIKYELGSKKGEAQDIEKVEQAIINIKDRLPSAEYAVSSNRVIITKIKVNAPIIEATNGDYALSKGSWLLPEGSTPDKGSNTIITGHRFKYLPPNNLTFYLFHELEIGDIVSIIWQEKDYFYKIKEIKIVEKTDFSILEPSPEPILTMFTCEPIYSQDKRLVVVAELLGK